MRVLLLTILCISLANCASLDKKVQNENIKKVNKRQVPMLPGASFMDYAAYDYYDWVCSGPVCQICDVLTGACCNPEQENCFLPDSCANNPCLSGGTCIPTRTISGHPDFVCACQRGLTGKYCQLIDEFTPPLVLSAPTDPLAVVPVPLPPAPSLLPPINPGQGPNPNPGPGPAPAPQQNTQFPNGNMMNPMAGLGGMLNRMGGMPGMGGMGGMPGMGGMGMGGMGMGGMGMGGMGGMGMGGMGGFGR